MKMTCLLVLTVLLPSLASADQGRCEFWFEVAGEAMTMRQADVQLERAVGVVMDYDLLDRHMVRRIIERAYKLPRRYTELGKQEVIEEYALAHRFACLEGQKERETP